jgi:hypothetical protein
MRFSGMADITFLERNEVDILYPGAVEALWDQRAFRPGHGQFWGVDSYDTLWFLSSSNDFDANDFMLLRVVRWDVQASKWREDAEFSHERFSP